MTAEPRRAGAEAKDPEVSYVADVPPRRENVAPIRPDDSRHSRRDSVAPIKLRNPAEVVTTDRIVKAKIPEALDVKIYEDTYGWIPEQMSAHMQNINDMTLFYFLRNTVTKLKERSLPWTDIDDVIAWSIFPIRDARGTSRADATWLFYAKPVKGTRTPDVVHMTEDEVNTMYRGSRHYRYLTLPPPQGFDLKLEIRPFSWFQLGWLREDDALRRVGPGMNIFEHLWIRLLSTSYTGVEFFDQLSIAAMNLFLVNMHYVNPHLRSMSANPSVPEGSVLAFHLADVARKILNAVVSVITYDVETMADHIDKTLARSVDQRAADELAGFVPIEEWARVWTYLCYWTEMYGLRARGQFHRACTGNLLALLETLGLCLAEIVVGGQPVRRQVIFKVWRELVPTLLAVANVEDKYYFSAWFQSGEAAVWDERLRGFYGEDEPVAPTSALPRQAAVCRRCGRLGSMRCKGCGTTVYCSKECAKADWPEHHEKCVGSV